MVRNISLDTTNINAINISTLDFRMWQHLSRNQTHPNLQKPTNVAEVPVTQLYRDMINACEPIHSFTIKDEEKDSSLKWTILKHPETSIGTVGMIFVSCICDYCFWFWIMLAASMHWPYSLVSSWHAIADDDVEVAIIYRCRGKVEKPVRPCRNHDLCIEKEAERLENCCKQLSLAKGVLYLDHWPLKPKCQEFKSSNGFGVDFSYCWINLEVLKYSLEQYIGFVVRQAFIHYLMKSTVVDESLSYYKTNVLFQRILQDFKTPMACCKT